MRTDDVFCIRDTKYIGAASDAQGRYEEVYVNGLPSLSEQLAQNTDEKRLHSLKAPLSPQELTSSAPRSTTSTPGDISINLGIFRIDSRKC
jgi:hypothetical protein